MPYIRSTLTGMRRFGGGDLNKMVATVSNGGARGTGSHTAPFFVARKTSCA